MTEKEMTFEQAKEKLDGIVEKLSVGNIPIDQMVNLYEQGAALSKYCLDLLSAYDARLEQVDKSLEKGDDDVL